MIVPARVSAAVGELAALVANAQPFMPAMKPPDASLHGHAYASRHGCSSTSAQCGLGGLQWHGATLAYGELLLPTDITLYVHLVQGHVYPCSAKRTASAENQDLGTFRRGTRNSVYIAQASEIELGLQREPQAHVTRTHWRIRKTVCTLVNVLKKHTLHSGRSGDLAFCSVPLRATHVVCSPCCLPDTRLHAGASQSAAGSTQTLSARCCC